MNLIHRSQFNDICMEGCPFRFAFKSGFNSLAYSVSIAKKNNISSGADCLIVNTICFDLM